MAKTLEELNALLASSRKLDGDDVPTIASAAYRGFERGADGYAITFTYWVNTQPDNGKAQMGRVMALDPRLPEGFNNILYLSHDTTLRPSVVLAYEV